MPTITTNNSLTEFDLCVALAQKALNSQMEAGWKAWKARKQFSDKISYLKVKEDGKIIDTDYGLKDVVFTPLKINLDVKNAKAAQVKVTLGMKSGKVIYYNRNTRKDAEYEISDWSVSFLTDLDKRAVDLKVLAQIDSQSFEAAKEAMAKSGLPDSAFSIEYLFLKLTQVNLMLSDNKDIQIPETVPSAARAQATETLNYLLNGEIGEFLMGTVVRKARKEGAPTFALTDLLFSLHPNSAAPDASTLDYLGMFSQAQMPKDTTIARLNLKDGWVRPEQVNGRESTVAGIMAISSRTFLEKYLIPKFKRVLRDVEWTQGFGTAAIGRNTAWEGPTPTRDKLTWTFADNLDSERTLPDAVGKLVMKMKQGYRLSVTVQPSANPQVTISGRIDCSVHVDGIPPIFEDMSTQWIYVDGHQDFSGSLKLKGNAIASDFNLESELAYSFQKAVLDKKVVGGVNILSFVSDIAKTLGLVSKNAEEMFTEAQEKTSEKLMGTLKSAFGRLDADLKQQVFIPPGGGVFTFQNPGFSKSGDLFLDILYRAP